MAWRTSEHRVRDDVHTCGTHFVSIHLPYRNESLERPPLILCLDGAWMAGTARDATRIMSMSGEAPEAIVAGVWFDEPTMQDYVRARARWYTPSHWVPPPATGVRGATAEELGFAETYRAFLRDGVLPFIADEVAYGETWLVGHSFSGLFGLHCLLHEPKLFDKYLLASPSIWWHDGVIFDLEEQRALEVDDLSAAVFMSAGESEMGDAGDDGVYRMRANMVEMAKRLKARRYPSLDLEWTVLFGESHNSTTSNAVNRGIRALHKMPRPAG